MRARLHTARATICLGLGLLVAAAAETARHPGTTVAAFAAAALLAELLQRAPDALSADGVDEQPFSLSVAVQLAAVLVLGPWPAALVGGGAVLIVRRLHEPSWPTICLRASLATAATVAGGLAFELGGGHVGHAALPADLMPALLLALLYFGTRALLLTAALPWHGTRLDPVVAAGEAAVGVLAGVFAAHHAWNLLALAPLVVLVQQAHARAVAAKAEVAAVLETFATIVDERDASTYRHSSRVAAYVAELAEALGLPPAEVARLRWAGRLHDIGNVAVDAYVLRKPDRLTSAEWATVQRAPKLSARLLYRFRFAATQARAVEYQRERYDGTGYYGIPADQLPLASHFLSVADSYDAMTTDRPFRLRLSDEEALEEIERNTGTQFHPMIARAFVALRRGRPVESVVAPEELAALRDSSLSYHLPHLPGLRDLRERPELVAVAGVAAALLGAGAGSVPVIALGAAAAAGGLGLREVRRFRARRLVAELRRAVAASDDRLGLFEWIAAAVSDAAGARWAGLVRWEEQALHGTIAFQRGEQRPADEKLMSWLMREAHAQEPIVAAEHELDGTGVTVALPLRRQNSALVGFLVFVLPGRAPAFVELALRDSLDELGVALADRPDASELTAAPVLSAVRETA
jgi:hypothetical protein